MRVACVIAGLWVVGCAPAVSTSAWVRTLPAARFVTAPAAAGDDVVLAVTTLDTGAVLDESGAPVALLAGTSRRATCTVLRLSVDGAVRWSLPVIARGGEALCTSVEVSDDEVTVRGEGFGVDTALMEAGGRLARVEEGFVLGVDDDGLVRSLEATPPPLLAFPEGAAALDVLGHELHAPSGTLQQNGAVDVDGATLVSLIVPPGTELAPLVAGAARAPGAAADSVVVLARVEP